METSTKRASILPENLTPLRRNLILGAVGLLLLWFVWSIRVVVNPLLLGYLAAYIMHPMVLRLERRGFKRRRAVNLIFLGGFLAGIMICGGVFFQGRALVRDVVANDSVRSEIGSALDRSREKLDGVLGIELPEVNMAALFEGAKALIAEAEPAGEAAVDSSQVHQFGVKAASSLWERLRSLLGSLVGIGGMLLLVPLYAYYLLFELGGVHAAMRRYFPKGDREVVANIGRQIGQMLSAFFRGRLLVCLLKGALISVGLLLAGFDYAFLFGMTAGALSLIPMVGPMIGFVVTAVASIPSFPELPAVDPVHFDVFTVFLRAALVFFAAEMIEGYVLMPKILGDSLRMNEVEVLFYLMAGGASLGMLGILLALPIAAGIKILLSEIILPALARFADEDAPSPSEGDTL